MAIVGTMGTARSKGECVTHAKSLILKVVGSQQLASIFCRKLLLAPPKPQNFPAARAQGGGLRPGSATLTATIIHAGPHTPSMSRESAVLLLLHMHAQSGLHGPSTRPERDSGANCDVLGRATPGRRAWLLRQCMQQPVAAANCTSSTNCWCIAFGVRLGSRDELCTCRTGSSRSTR